MSVRRELELEAARAAWVSTGCQGDFAAGWDLGVTYGRTGELEAMRKRLDELEAELAEVTTEAEADRLELDQAIAELERARLELDPGVS